MNNNILKSIKTNESIAKKLSLKLVVIFVGILFAVLLIAYFVVSNIVIKETLYYNNTISNTIVDLNSSLSSREEAINTIDEDNLEFINTINEYYCKWYRIDYVYTYAVLDNGKKIKVLDYSSKDSVDIENSMPLDSIGKEIDYNPTDEELEYWFNEEYSNKPYYKKYNNSEEALAIEKDAFGNLLVVGVGTSIKSIYNSILEEFIPLFIIVLAIFVLMYLIIYYIIYQSVYAPAREISEAMTSFINNDFKTTSKLAINSKDEFSMISSSFNKLTEAIDTYIKNINRLTGIQERQKAELEIASNIQKAMLGKEEYRSNECDIRAMMLPAKEVGGDLYDYMVLDDGKILFTIADVSGKGVAASLYMSTVLVSIHLLADTISSPSKILEKINNMIASRNPNLFFITVFMGIYDPKTHEFVYCNAGHNLPYLVNDKVTKLSGAKNLVLGLYEDEKYVEDKIKLNAGDIIYMYTDGVTEAINFKEEFYTDNRLIHRLEEYIDNSNVNIIEFITDDITKFVDGYGQYDDMTMLAFMVKE